MKLTCRSCGALNDLPGGDPMGRVAIDARCRACGGPLITNVAVEVGQAPSRREPLTFAPHPLPSANPTPALPVAPGEAENRKPFVLAGVVLGLVTAAFVAAAWLVTDDKVHEGDPRLPTTSDVRRGPTGR